MIYGTGWQCVVGSNFGCFFTHSKGTFIYFTLETLNFLIFKGASSSDWGCVRLQRNLEKMEEEEMKNKVQCSSLLRLFFYPFLLVLFVFLSFSLWSLTRLLLDMGENKVRENGRKKKKNKKKECWEAPTSTRPHGAFWISSLWWGPCNISKGQAQCPLCTYDVSIPFKMHFFFICPLYFHALFGCWEKIGYLEC